MQRRERGVGSLLGDEMARTPPSCPPPAARRYAARRRAASPRRGRCEPGRTRSRPRGSGTRCACRPPHPPRPARRPTSRRPGSPRRRRGCASVRCSFDGRRGGRAGRTPRGSRGRTTLHQSLEVGQGIADDLVLRRGVRLREEAPMRRGRGAARICCQTWKVGRMSRSASRSTRPGWSSASRYPTRAPRSWLATAKRTWPSASMTAITSRPMARLE